MATPKSHSKNGSKHGSNDLQVLMLGLQDEIFAVEAGVVREILDPVPVTEVPGARAFVGGVINVRGRIVPLADLRRRSGMELSQPTIDTRIIVVEVTVDGDPTIVGILADKVYEVTGLDASSIAEAPRIGMGWQPEFIRFIGKRNDDFIIVPDLARILS